MILTQSIPGKRTGLEDENGFVLLAVLVFILLLSMLVVSLLFRSRADETAAQASRGTEQAWATVLSGIQVAIQVAIAAPGGSTDWQDNPAVFRDRPVFDDGADQWFFTVYSPSGSGDAVEIRYGLSDEAARINLNSIGAADLTHVPRMTAAMVQSLRQFITAGPSSVNLSAQATGGGSVDSNSDTAIPNITTASVTTDFLADGFTASVHSGHGHLSTVEEVLLVPVFSRTLWFGEDANLNGHLDPNEDDGNERFPPDNHDGRLDRGMAQYFTVNSWGPELSNAGKPRIDLNNTRAALPETNLPPGFATFVTALRTAKMKLNHPVQLLGATIQVTNEAGAGVEISSGIQLENLAWLLDGFTTGSEDRHDGRINVNTASAAVLATLPGIDLPLAETIVSTRTALSPERRVTPAWLLQEGVMDADKFKGVVPSLTCRASQFHFFVLGYGMSSGRYRVAEVSIDVAGRQPKVTYLRDMTRLGLPFRPGGEGTNSPAVSGDRAALFRPGTHPLNFTPHG